MIGFVRAAVSALPSEAWTALGVLGAAATTALGGVAIARTGRATSAASEGLDLQRLALEEIREIRALVLGHLADHGRARPGGRRA
jgi:hypothetical protein